MKRSCGKTLGHGVSCVPNYQCDSCKYIERLQKRNRDLKRVYKAMSAVFVMSTPPNIDPNLWNQAIVEIEAYETREKK